jgi:type II secretory pathway component GspD/PulD (secretin)
MKTIHATWTKVFVSSRVIRICTLLVFLAAVGASAQQIYCSSANPASQESETSAYAASVKEKGTARRFVELKSQSVLCNFNFHIDERSVIDQVLSAYGIQAIIDSSVTSRQIRFDVQQLTFADASALLKLATETFFVALSPTQVLVLLDTKENRGKYEKQLEEQISMPGLTGAELTEMQGATKTIFEIDHGISQNNQGRTVVRAPEAELTAMNGAYHELFAEHSELWIEVSVYEIDRTNDSNGGATLPNSSTLFNVRSEINSIIANNSALVQEIISSGLASAGDYEAILVALLASGELSGTVFNSPFVLFGGGLTETGVEWNTTSANMLLNSSDVRSLNRMQLRVLDHEEATFRSGERYPIMSSSYTALSASSSSSSSTVTVPEVQYQDLGLTLKVKPSIENEDSIALGVDLKISSLAGSSINDVPVLANRQYSGDIVVHFGNSALITSAISRQDALAISGYPGLGATDRQKDATHLELVVLVTPHLLRISHPESAGTMWLLPVH